MTQPRLSFILSEDFKSLVEAWCESEGITVGHFLRKVVAQALEWTLTPEDEPPPQAKTKKAGKTGGNKRAESIQAAIQAARERLNNESLPH